MKGSKIIESVGDVSETYICEFLAARKERGVRHISLHLYLLVEREVHGLESKKMTDAFQDVSKALFISF